jgi:regulator of replication initiation timing
MKGDVEMKTLQEVQELIQKVNDRNYKLQRIKDKHDEIKLEKEKLEKQLGEKGFTTIERAKQFLEEEIIKAEKFIQDVDRLEIEINEGLKEIDGE